MMEPRNDLASVSAPLSRRRALQMLGVAGAAATIAGCSRDSSGGKKSDRSDGGATFKTWYPYDAPPVGSYQTLSGVLKAIPVVIGYLYDYMMLPGAMYRWDSQSFYYLLADKTSTLAPDGKTFTYKVRPGQKWSDGSPITAKDVYATWMCKYVVRSPVYDYVDSVIMSDEMTVTFTIGKPAPIAQYYLLRERIVPESVYGDFAKLAEPLVKAKKDQADAQVVKLNKQILAFKPAKVVASGPFNLEVGTVGAQQLTLLKNENCYLSKDVRFDKVVVYGSSDFSSVIPIVLQKQVYYNTGGLTVATESAFKKAGLRILRPPIYSGPALFFNYDKAKDFADKRVRQALCQAFDHVQNGKVALGDSGKKVELFAGLADSIVPKWLSTADQKRLNHYPFDVKVASATLTAAGWSRRGSRWHTPSGSSAQFELLFPSDYPDWSAAAQNLQGQLDNFGIKLVLRGEQSTQVALDVDQGKFTLAIQGWGSSTNPFPTDSFRAAMFTHNSPSLRPASKGMDFPMKQHTDAVGEVDLEQVVIASAFGATPDDLKKSTTTAALAFNELLPVIPLWERYGNNAVLPSAVDGYPDDGDPIYRNSPYADNFSTILTFEGTLKPA